jgi:hypothetical protein
MVMVVADVYVYFRNTENPARILLPVEVDMVLSSRIYGCVGSYILYV